MNDSNQPPRPGKKHIIKVTLHISCLVTPPSKTNLYTHLLYQVFLKERRGFLTAFGMTHMYLYMRRKKRRFVLQNIKYKKIFESPLLPPSIKIALSSRMKSNPEPARVWRNEGSPSH